MFGMSDPGDGMEVEDVATDRTGDGGVSGGSDVENKDTDMAEANGKIKTAEVPKEKRKKLNRRDRKALPSKEEIAQKRYSYDKTHHLVEYWLTAFGWGSTHGLASFDLSYGVC